MIYVVAIHVFQTISYNRDVYVFEQVTLNRSCPRVVEVRGKLGQQAAISWLVRTKVRQVQTWPKTIFNFWGCKKSLNLIYEISGVSPTLRYEAEPSVKTTAVINFTDPLSCEQKRCILIFYHR